MIHILCASDDEFSVHTTVMLTSLLQNTKFAISVHWFQSGISNDSRQKIDRYIKSKYNMELFFYDVSYSEVNELRLYRHLGQAAYYRLIAPNEIDNRIEKIIYLDSDIIVRSCISGLWKTQIGGLGVGAVRDAFVDEWKEMGIATGNYFNSGVMIIDLEYWRRNAIYQYCAKFLSENEQIIRYADQDALNVAFKDHWYGIEMKWNVQSNCFERYLDFPDSIFNPNIVHFTGEKTKPWLYTGRKRPFAYEYAKYRSLTPWPDFRLEGRPNAWKKLVREYRRLISRI